MEEAFNNPTKPSAFTLPELEKVIKTKQKSLTITQFRKLVRKT